MSRLRRGGASKGATTSRALETRQSRVSGSHRTAHTTRGGPSTIAVYTVDQERGLLTLRSASGSTSAQRLSPLRRSVASGVHTRAVVTPAQPSEAPGCGAEPNAKPTVVRDDNTVAVTDDSFTTDDGSLDAADTPSAADAPGVLDPPTGVDPSDAPATDPPGASGPGGRPLLSDETVTLFDRCPDQKTKSFELSEMTGTTETPGTSFERNGSYDVAMSAPKNTNVEPIPPEIYDATAWITCVKAGKGGGSWSGSVTVISSKRVLTARHVLCSTRAGDYTVQFLNRSTGLVSGTKFHAAKLIFPGNSPKATKPGPLPDLGALDLMEREFAPVRSEHPPLPIGSPTDTANGPAIIAGYGQPSKGILQWGSMVVSARLPTYDSSVTYSEYAWDGKAGYKTVRPWRLYARGLKLIKDASTNLLQPGDSGGPVLKWDGSRYKIVGVNSQWVSFRIKVAEDDYAIAADVTPFKGTLCAGTDCL